MKKFLSKYWPAVVLILLGVSICWPLFVRGYFSHHDDLQVMRIFEIRKCFSDFQLPCRWVPDMGYGNGFPLFNYYGPLPYYLGGLVSYLLGYINSVKFIFFISLVFAGISMYLLGKEVFGKAGGFIAGTLYLLAPYRALDAYVRGALSELFALALIPLVFFFILKLIRKPRLGYLLGFILFLSLFLITHNIMTLLFVPALCIWSILYLYLEKGKNFKIVLLAYIISFGLSSFFTIPAFFEKNLVQTESLTRFELDFRAHFVTIKQLFLDRTWGYGASILGPNDTISFQIGWPHWWLVLASLIGILGPRTKKKNRLLGGLLLILFLVSIFMTHNKSAFVWESISVLKFFQFPWRFLSLTIFSASLLGGFVVSLAKEYLQKYVLLAILIVTVTLNWGFFKPGEFYFGLTDKEKLTGAFWEEQQKGAILDYLPKTALEPKEKAPTIPEAKKGSATVENFENRSNKWSFTTEVESQAYIEVPVFYFPEWKVKIDGGDAPLNFENYLGRIGVIVSAGEHAVEGIFTNTPIRTISNIISVLSALAAISLVLYGKNRKIFE